MEKIHTALDTKDAIATHTGTHDPFVYHMKEAPVIGTVAELTDISEEFAEAVSPSHAKLESALEIKDRLAAHGLKLPEEEAVWREELEEGVAEANSA